MLVSHAIAGTPTQLAEVRWNPVAESLPQPARIDPSEQAYRLNVHGAGTGTQLAFEAIALAGGVL